MGQLFSRFRNTGNNVPPTNVPSKNIEMEDCNIEMKDYNIEMEDYNIEMEDCNIEMKDYNIEMEDYNIEMKDYNIEMKDYNIEMKDYLSRLSLDDERSSTYDMDRNLRKGKEMGKKDSVIVRDQHEYSWSNCIKMLREKKEDEKIAKKLLENKILPSKDELNEIYHLCGKRSKLLSNICNAIGEHIKASSEGVIEAWSSYRNDNISPDSNICIAFVVIIEKASPFSGFKDYEYHIRRANELDNEGKLVAEKEMEEKSRLDNSKYDIKEMIICINKHADDLLDKHSNLNAIMPSLVKSTGYRAKEHIFSYHPCIALYVTGKGYIPLDEDPFEKKIGEFEIDVLEGEFEPFTGGPNNYHDHLKNGLAIHANNVVGKDGNALMCGTLGGFIDHFMYGLCGITCGHVVYNPFELQLIMENKPFANKEVYQPPGHNASPFGIVVKAIFKEGNDKEAGIDVALIQINCRHPTDGSFPEAFNDIDAGFDENNPLTYNSGEVCETSSLNGFDVAYKFGMQTGITRGLFGVKGTVVRTRKQHAFGIRLKNQIVILPAEFADHGDSGALVFKRGSQDSVAVGIVEGGVGGRVLVTPICDILRALGCQEMKMHRFNQIQNHIFTDVHAAKEPMQP